MTLTSPAVDGGVTKPRYQSATKETKTLYEAEPTILHSSRYQRSSTGTFTHLDGLKEAQNMLMVLTTTAIMFATVLQST